MDTLASEYGWTQEHILERVYPLQAFSLFPRIAKRQLNAFIDLLEVQVLTKHDIKPEERGKWIRQIDRMRSGADQSPPEKPFDRAKFEQLREIINGPNQKGKGPKRV